MPETESVVSGHDSGVVPMPIVPQVADVGCQDRKRILAMPQKRHHLDSRHADS